MKVSEAEGLRDSECGCNFEPFVFIECRRALPGETGANGLGVPPAAALGIIGQVASRPVNKIEKSG